MAAPLSLRFRAGAIDLFMVFLIEYVAFFLLGGGWSSPAFLIFFFLSPIIYFAFPEGIWGASLGKKLCGLRVVRIREDQDAVGVVTLRPDAVGVPRAFARTTIFWFGLAARFGHPLLCWFITRRELEKNTERRDLPFWHDVVTKTAVVLKPA